MSGIEINSANLAGLASEILGAGHHLRFRARGFSMTPFIHDGDVIHVQPCQTIRRGDVVLCAVDERGLLAHRVVYMHRGRETKPLVVQGDACPHPDRQLSLEDVLGKVVAVERNDRLIPLSTGLSRSLGLLWMISSPFSQRLYRYVAGLFNRAVHTA